MDVSLLACIPRAVVAGVFRILEAFFAAHSTGEGKWVPSRDFFRQVSCHWSKVEAIGRTGRSNRLRRLRHHIPTLRVHIGCTTLYFKVYRLLKNYTYVANYDFAHALIHFFMYYFFGDINVVAPL